MSVLACRAHRDADRRLRERRSVVRRVTDHRDVPCCARPARDRRHEDKGISASLVTVHLYTTCVLVVLILGYVAAPAYHLLIRRERIIERMLPGH